MAKNSKQTKRSNTSKSTNKRVASSNKVRRPKVARRKLEVVDPMLVPVKRDYDLEDDERELETYDEVETIEEVSEAEEDFDTEAILEEAGFRDELEDEVEELELEEEDDEEVEDEASEASLLYPEEEEDLEKDKKLTMKDTKEKKRKKWSKKKKVLVGFLVVILLAIIAVVTYGFLLLGKTTSVFEGSPFDAIFGADLKTDENGRSNFLVFGTSEDDEGHSGALLADSIIILSMNAEQQDAKMFSIPRDLWVSYGMACSVGYQGKINATFLCGLESNSDDYKVAGKYFTDKVGELFGMDIQYFVAVNYTVVREVTNNLGGIDVDVYSDDPRGLYDINMGLNLSAGVNHLDGEQAMKLIRARNAKGGYGLSRSNFDREINQQRVIQGMLKKAGPSILANPGQAMSLIESLGDNIKTNVTMGEARKVIEKVAGLDKGVESLETTKLFTTGNINGASVVIPVGATATNPFYYDGLQAWAHDQFAVGDTE